MRSANLRSVSVGIPAHNEEKNIVRLLDQIFAQNQDGFVLESVIVACDGCTDGTISLLEDYAKHNPALRIIGGAQRLGKSRRMSELYKTAMSDILVTLDADVVIGHANVLKNLAASFVSPKIGLVGGLDLPMTPRNLVQKIAVEWIRAWYLIRIPLHGGVNVHNHAGCISALSKSFYTQLRIPEGIASDDEYLFFAALSSGFMFRLCKRAYVFYRVPATMPEYIQQSVRFISTKHYIIEHFGEWAEDYYKVPFKLRTATLARELFKHPLLMTMSLGAQIMIRISQRRSAPQAQSELWTIANSSK